MLRFESYPIPAASLGELNPMPDIKNNTYIHAGYEITSRVSSEERQYIGKGMLNTILPYQMQDGYDRNRQIRKFNAAILENEYLCAVFLPEVGGRLWSLYDKTLKKELLYKNTVFQPCNLGLRNAWYSGGVEFNVGIKGHNTLTCSPLFCEVEETPDGELLVLYEYERIRGVVYSISAWLPEDSQVLYIRGRIENTSNEQKYMYWWSNIAVPETQHTRVLVPADEAFLCHYLENHYLLDKTPVPYALDTDISYPYNLNTSHDFFYKIPEQSPKWIATADENGKGLLQCSTDTLYGRKTFLWGKGQGGRNWNSFLSEQGQAYVEIQAGLAHTQLEHIPMPPHSEWSWVEAYTALNGDAEKLNSSDWETAKAEAENCLHKRISNPHTLYFPPENSVTHKRTVYYGSGWGAVEEQLRGEYISKYHSFSNNSHDPETIIWERLLSETVFTEPEPQSVPVSYVTDHRFLEKLTALPEQNWYSMFHSGVIRYALGDIDGASKSWYDSISLRENAWSYRCLAMLAKNEYGNLQLAQELILKAHELLPYNKVLCIESAMILTASDADGTWLDIYKTLPSELQLNGRLRLYCAIALMHQNRLREAAEIINASFVLNDIKEGELSISQIWFELYRRLYAEETGITDNKAADERYPLPAKLDFRMA